MLAIELLAAFALVAANGFFVATEFAIARIRLTQAEELEDEGRPGARALRHAVEQIDAYLAACQLGITIASIGLGIVGKPAFEEVAEPITGELGDAAYILSFAFAFGTVTLLHVVLGELAPKSLAIARNTRTALAVAVPMRAFYVATKPLVDFFNWLGNLVLRPFGVPPAREVGHAPHSETELRELLRQSLHEGLIDPSDAEFSEKAFVFGDRQVQDVLTPRPDVVGLPAEAATEEALAMALATPYSRLPVYEDSLDRVLGVVHLRDLAAAVNDGRGRMSIRALVRPPYFVPETKELAELLAELRRRREHMALVLDEYGGLAGLVTLEDLVEEIVGDIQDEYDPPAEEVEVLGEGHARISGSMSIEDFNARFAEDLPVDRFHTVAGYVFDVLGRGAERGDEVRLDGALLRVLETDGPRIDRLEVVAEAAAGEAGGTPAA